MAEQRLTQNYAEIAVSSDGTPNARATQSYAEVAVKNDGAPNARVAQVFAEYVVTSLTYTITLTGAVSSSGSLSKQTNKPLAGVLDSSGTLSGSSHSQQLQSVDGSLTFAGTLSTQVTHRFTQSVSGVLDLSGALTTHLYRLYTQAVSGVLDLAGTLNGVLHQTQARITKVFAEIVNQSATAAIRVTKMFAELVMLNMGSTSTPSEYPGSPYSRIRHVAYGQNNRDNRWNASMDDQVSSLCGVLAITMNAGAPPRTVTMYPEGGELLRNSTIEVSGSLAADGTLYLPGVPKLLTVINKTAVNLTFRTTATSGVTVASGKAQEIYYDGTNWIAVSPAV